jgi:uncharacterized protein (DUF924 family)
LAGDPRPPQEILEFWFADQARSLWFEKNADFDALIRSRFEATHQAALAGRLDAWEDAAESCLALVILLDQFPRNMYRGSARAYAADARAHAVAERAIARGHDRRFAVDRRHFFYLPFEHSENLADQRRAVALFRADAEAAAGSDRERAHERLDYAERHLAAIERFGRFPHRNELLGRETTEDEAAYLRDPRSWF